MNERTQLIILLSSSTAFESGMSMGPSVCVWTAYIYRPDTDEHSISRQLPEETRFENAILMEGQGKRPVRSGSVFNNIDTPTRMFYDGVIRALEACFYLLRREEVTETLVLGNDQYALRQINGESAVDEMEPLYNQVVKLRERYELRCPVVFRYLPEQEYTVYRKLNQLTQEMQEVIAKL